MSDLIRHVRHKTCIVNFTTPFLDLVLSSLLAILFPRALRFFWSRGLVRFKLSRVALGTKAVMRRRGRRALGSIGNTHVTSSTQRDKGRQKKRTERSLISEGGEGDALPLSSASGPPGAHQKVCSRLETRLENFPFLTTEYMRWCEHNANPMFVKPCNLTLPPRREEESGPWERSRNFSSEARSRVCIR